jgi:flagellar biosynthesis/type III secretory pathway protein FliH
MSTKAMQDFMSMVASTEALHAAAIQAWAHDGMDAVIALGHKHGYAFTPEEIFAVRDAANQLGSSGNTQFDAKLAQAMKEAEELSDTDLDLVSGGSMTGPQPAPNRKDIG